MFQDDQSASKAIRKALSDCKEKLKKIQLDTPREQTPDAVPGKQTPKGKQTPEEKKSEREFILILNLFNQIE